MTSLSLEWHAQYGQEMPTSKKLEWRFVVSDATGPKQKKVDCALFALRANIHRSEGLKLDYNQEEMTTCEWRKHVGAFVLRGHLMYPFQSLERNQV